MDVLLILLFVFVVFGVIGAPQLHIHNLGYTPSGLFWTLAVVCLIVWLVRRRRTL